MPRVKVITPRKISHQGYIQVYMPGHHRANRLGYVMEHIVIAEIKVGRKIFKKEAVHHVDKDKTNNDPDNLMVLSHSEHASIHGRDRKGKKRPKRFNNVSSGEDKEVKYESVAKDKLPRGYYYLRTFKNKRKTEKNKENA